MPLFIFKTVFIFVHLSHEAIGLTVIKEYVIFCPYKTVLLCSNFSLLIFGFMMLPINNTNFSEVFPIKVNENINDLRINSVK